MERLYWIEGRNRKKISVIAHFPEDSAFRSEPKPVLIYCHGFTANKLADNRMGVNMARDLCKRGYLFIRFDFIGSGESEGQFETDTYFSGWLEDLSDVMAWLPSLEQADTGRIGLIGHSLGGAIVTHYCASDDRIKAVCTLAPVTYLKKNFEEIIIGPTLWKRACESEVIQNFYNKKYSLSPFFVEDLLNYDIPSCAKTVTQPFLIIHGREDIAVPIDHSYDLLEYLSSSDKELVALEQEGHLLTPVIHPTLTKWFGQKL